MTQWNIDSSHSSVEFSVKHFGVSWVKGRFAKIEGNAIFDLKNPETGGSLTVEIKMNSIWTGDEARDNHLRSKDFFDVEKYPLAIFKSASIENVRNNEYKIAGDLTLRGITHPVVLEGSFLGMHEVPSGKDKELIMRAGFSAHHD